MPPYRTIPSNEEPSIPTAAQTEDPFNFLASLINGNQRNQMVQL